MCKLEFLNFFHKKYNNWLSSRYLSRTTEEVLDSTSFHQVPKQEEKILTISRYRNNYRTDLYKRIIERAENDLKKGYIRKAISRYEGFFKHYPCNQSLHSRVGILYLELRDEKNAGKHFYFKKNPTERELECIRFFENAYGNSTVLILKNVLSKENYKASDLDDFSKEKLYQKIIEVEKELGLVPNFLKGKKRHLVKRANNK